MPVFCLLLASLGCISADSARTYQVGLASAESLSVTEEGAGQPVVLIPGLFGSAYTYRKVMPLLAERGYRAIVIEPLGIGFSGRPEKADYSLTAQAARLAETIDQLGLQEVVLIGHSVGASIAYRIAISRPDLVRAVVSVEGGAAETAMTQGSRSAMRFIPWVKWLGGMKLIRGRIRKGLYETGGDTTWVTDEVVNGYAAGAAVDLDRTLKAMRAMARAKEPEQLKPRLPEVRAPLLVLKGSISKGGIPPDEVAALAAAVPVFRLDTVPESGLYIQEVRPVAIVDAVASVLTMGREQLASPEGGEAVR